MAESFEAWTVSLITIVAAVRIEVSANTAEMGSCANNTVVIGIEKWEGVPYSTFSQ